MLRRCWPLLCLLSSFFVLNVLLFTASNAQAQEMRGVAVQGYVTAVQPDGFDVHGLHVKLQPSTSYGMQKAKTSEINSPLKSELKVGAYVWVLGSFKHDVATAQTVRFRDDWNRNYEGFGPIAKVVSAGPGPVFSADGFPIRIAASAATTFHGTVKSTADAGANDWIHYKARRNSDGVLVASQADFVRVDPKRLKVVDDAEDFKVKFEAPDLAQHKDGQVMLGVVGKWYTISADRPLQERLAHIGMNLVPKLQRALPESDPGKIKFLFYAVNDPKLRNIFCSPRGGLILVPRHLIERMHNDDQLAAALAYAVAAVLQRQGLSKEMQQWPMMRDEVATLGIYAFSPFGAAILLDFAGSLPDHQVQSRLLEQCGRIALSLMADAGYDPWQAPEAFRLIAPKELPKDLNTLKYTDLSGYVLGVLNLEYRQPSAAETKASASSAEPAK